MILLKSSLNALHKTILKVTLQATAQQVQVYLLVLTIWLYDENFSLGYMQKVVEYCEEHPNYSFKPIQQRFRRLSHRN